MIINERKKKEELSSFQDGENDIFLRGGIRPTGWMILIRDTGVARKMKVKRERERRSGAR